MRIKLSTRQGYRAVGAHFPPYPLIQLKSAFSAIALASRSYECVPFKLFFLDIINAYSIVFSLRQTLLIVDSTRFLSGGCSPQVIGRMS
jgi:hypothetical protein